MRPRPWLPPSWLLQYFALADGALPSLPLQSAGGTSTPTWKRTAPGIATPLQLRGAAGFGPGGQLGGG